MARTWLARAKAHENGMERRMANELRTVATLAGVVYAQFARKRTDEGQLIIEDTRANRQAVKDAMWNRVVAPYFGVQGNQLDRQAALNPFMRLIKDGVEGAVRIQAEQHIEIIEKNAPRDVVDFLMGARAPQFVGEISPHPPAPSPTEKRGRGVAKDTTPEYGGGNKTPSVAGATSPPNMGESMPTAMIHIAEQGGNGRRTVRYDPWHRFVDENGYTLSDKGWRTSQEVRESIDSLLDMHIPLGTSAVDVADMLVQYLYPEAARIRTRTPYGYDGSYWARRLARTEITAAAGRSTLNAAWLNPFVDRMDWALSLQHKEIDICDEYAAGSPYELGNVPSYPAHPHDGCTLRPRVVENRTQVVGQLQEMMLAGYDESMSVGGGMYTRRDLQGAFNLDWLVSALLSGALIEILRRAYE